MMPYYWQKVIIGLETTTDLSGGKEELRLKIKPPKKFIKVTKEFRNFNLNTEENEDLLYLY